ncbi:MAG TPA: septum formation initiator subfamily, partial [Alcanivorax sp.]|nr:septum formation initiator subfamily [Alcanivorax sp.]HBY48931.1 septum formation initiator subfamily [Alcanivorax sp.]
KNAELAERNRLLAADVRDLKEGTEAVEEIARKDLGMIRDGESFFLIVEPQQDPDRD